jgi:hypothetical protein
MAETLNRKIQEPRTGGRSIEQAETERSQGQAEA